MSGATSKRQQARNERALQDLVKNVPGNDCCADCGARNPGEKLRSRLSNSTNSEQDGRVGMYDP